MSITPNPLIKDIRTRIADAMTPERIPPKLLHYLYEIYDLLDPEQEDYKDMSDKNRMEAAIFIVRQAEVIAQDAGSLGTILGREKLLNPIT